MAYELTLWHKGCSVIGVDEAGRGPLAGPVVAAAFVLHQGTKDLTDLLALGVADSKKVTPKKREAIYTALTHHAAVHWAVGMVDEQTIDRINILEATLLAMRHAVTDVLRRQKNTQCMVCVDGREIIPDLMVDQKAVIDGDAKIFSIAAASIIAKVTRDRIMTEEYAQKYPAYGFEQHKGYGTKAHFARVAEHGLSPAHRVTFFKKSLDR